MESTTLATKLAAFVLLTVVAVGTIQRILQNAARGKDIHFPLVQPLPLFGRVLSINTQSI